MQKHSAIFFIRKFTNKNNSDLSMAEIGLGSTNLKLLRSEMLVVSTE